MNRGHYALAQTTIYSPTPLRCTQTLMLNIHNIDSRTLDLAEVERASLAFELLLQGKWKLQILSVMCSGPVRLGQLARLIPGASKKVLTQNLRKLEADGIVVRTDFSNVVLHVEYDLSPDLRDSVCRLLNELDAWGDQYVRWSTTDPQVPRQGRHPSGIPRIAPPKTVKSAHQSEPEPLSRGQNALHYATDVIGEAEHMQLSEGDSVKVLSLVENPPAPNAKLQAAARTRQRRR